MSAGNRALVRPESVVCETCGAGEGEPCVDVRDDERVIRSAHWRRRHEAAELSRVVREIAAVRRVRATVFR